MSQILFVKETAELLKENDFVIGNFNRKCKIGKVISISEVSLVIEVYDNNGDIDDVICRNLLDFNIVFFKAKKIDIDYYDDNFDYCIIEN